MRSLDKPSEFGGRNQRYIARSPSSNNDGLLLVHYLVEYRGEVLAEAGVCRFARHKHLIVQNSCTYLALPLLLPVAVLVIPNREPGSHQERDV